jgi:6-phosphogluconate dehydrogenase
MQLGMVGLGKMGNYMTQRLLEGGHEVVGYDRSAQAVAEAAASGAAGATSLADMVSKLTEKPPVAWVMVPAGAPTDDTIHQIADIMGPGGIIIDGGNTNYKDGLRLYADCKAKGVSLIDAGTSGGVWGLEEGYCLMVGGDDVQVRHCEPIFLTLAPPNGYAHVGPAGAGHFSKMVHNGIEYGLLQAYGEGFEILKNSQYDYDLGQLAELWTHASVVRSWLLELLVLAFKEDPGLKDIRGYVEDTGEGRWTVQAAIDEGVPAPVLCAALFARFSSRGTDDYADKLLSAMRYAFGGHLEKKA